MSLNSELMKKKLAKAKGKGSSNFYKLDEGQSATVRILPTEDGDPFKEYHFHYNVGSQSFLCPKRNYNEDCAVCDFANKLWNTGEEADKEAARQLFAKPRYFSPIVVRASEDEGVKVWGYSKTVYETLLNLVLNPDYGDITDVDAGTDLDLKSEKAAGVRYASIAITPKRKNSALAKTKAGAGSLLESVPDITAMHRRLTSEEVATAMDAHMNSASAEEVTTAAATSNESDISEKLDAAFEELGGEAEAK